MAERWVIRVDDMYLMTPHWGDTTNDQRQACDFDSLDQARSYARSWRKHPDFEKKRIRVVRIVPSIYVAFRRAVRANARAIAGIERTLELLARKLGVAVPQSSAAGGSSDEK